jgi:hypothetical protein
MIFYEGGKNRFVEISKPFNCRLFELILVIHEVQFFLVVGVGFG